MVGLYAADTAVFARRERSLLESLGALGLAALQLAVPVLLLSLTLVGCFLELEHGLPALDLVPPHLWQWNPGYWLSVGHLMLPLAFFVVNLTSRRRGPGFALAQVLVTWLVLGAGALWLSRTFGGLSTESLFPPLETSLAFLGAFGLAQMVNIRIFDRVRGRTWWGAPLWSTLWAGFIFAVIFYPVSMMGQTESFLPHLVTDLVTKIVAAVVLLVPYWLLRPLIKTAPGYGGA